MDNNPFDSTEDNLDTMDEVDLSSDSYDEGEGAELGDVLAEDFGQLDATDSMTSDEAIEADFGDDAGEAFDGDGDMALWNAFEEEVADGLDAADEDEFIGRLLGGLGRAGGVLGRVSGIAGGIARNAGRFSRVARRVSPAGAAASRLARLLGARGASSRLGSARRGAGRAARLGRQAGRMARRGAGGSIPGLPGGLDDTSSEEPNEGGDDNPAALLAQISQLIGGGGDEFDDFDALADLWDEGVDEALPGLVGLAARAAARGLGLRNLAHLSQAGRRALVRGVASAARELVTQGGPRAVRALPRLAHSAGRVAQRQAPTPQQAAQQVRRGLPRTARRVAQNPQAVRRAAQPAASGPRAAPIARPTALGRGTPRPMAVDEPRSFTFRGPVTVTLTPQ